MADGGTRAAADAGVIGYLNASSPGTVYVEPLRALRDGFKESGYVERENVEIEYRWSENDPNRLPILAANLVHRRVYLIAASSASASLAAAKATSTIPIVFIVPKGPATLGLVRSLARPGGNATGVNPFSAELAAKRLELLRMLLPAATRVAALLNPAEPSIAAATRRDVEAAASVMGLQVRIYNASTIAQIETTFEALASERPDALFISGGPFFANRRVQLAQLAARHLIPAVHSGRQFPEVGGLMGYGASLTGGTSPTRRLCGPHPQRYQTCRLAGRAIE